MHQAGCGLMGELGACTVNSRAVQLFAAKISGIKDPVAKLKSILQDPYLSISPHMTSAVPPINNCTCIYSICVFTCISL